MQFPVEVLKIFEITAMLTGAAYAILAARRNRLCWIAGAVSSALAALLAGLRGLPMQSALQVFFVGMWPYPSHLIAALLVTALSFATAQLLAAETRAAWPLLDSLTTGFSLLATWLAARAKLENWLYWIVIDGVLVFLFYVQDLPFLAFLNVLFIGIAAGGFIAWRRRLHAQLVPA